jgi:hypothetical protein
MADRTVIVRIDEGTHRGEVVTAMRTQLRIR